MPPDPSVIRTYSMSRVSRHHWRKAEADLIVSIFNFQVLIAWISWCKLHTCLANTRKKNSPEVNSHDSVCCNSYYCIPYLVWSPAPSKPSKPSKPSFLWVSERYTYVYVLVYIYILLLLHILRAVLYCSFSVRILDLVAATYRTSLASGSLQYSTFLKVPMTFFFEAFHSHFYLRLGHSSFIFHY